MRETRSFQAAPTRAEVDALMKRCQIGVGPRQMGEAHDIMAECYGTLGALMLEVERLRAEALHAKELVRRLNAEAWYGGSMPKDPEVLHMAKRFLGA